MKKDHLKEQASRLIDSFLDNTFETFDYNKLNKSSTAIVIVDMVNGFAKSGNLYSYRVEKIVGNIKKLLENMDESEKLFLCDDHSSDAVEFKLFPEHCIASTKEAEIVEELLPFTDNATIIKKNSTNGFLEPKFLDWLKSSRITDYIIVGCCTDLCIQQFATTLKAHFNRINESADIIVPVDFVETYDLDVTNHPGDFMHLIALKQMMDNGIKIIRTIK